MYALCKFIFFKAGVGGEHRSRSSEGGRGGSGEQMLVLSAQEIKCVLRERGVSERELLKWSERQVTNKESERASERERAREQESERERARERE